MAFVNYNNKEITVKIVYYGPPLSGKTTCLQYIYNNIEFRRKGKIITLDTDGDRTLFFDFLPIEIRKLRDYSIKMQIYTVQGQVRDEITRKLILQGADGVVFVADSQALMRKQNVASLRNLKDNLKANKISFSEIPLIFQYNRRDFREILPIDVLNGDLNPDNKPFFPTIATTGENVLEALHTIMKMVIIYLKNKLDVFQSDATKDFSEAKTKTSYREDASYIPLSINKIKTEAKDEIGEISDTSIEIESVEYSTIEKLIMEDELKARYFISTYRYYEGREPLLKIIGFDASRKKRLSEEFGFLFDFSNSPEKDELNWDRKQAQINWRRKIWKIISAYNPFPLENISDVLILESKQKQEIAIDDIYDREGKTPETKGKDLEQVMMKLFQEFLFMCETDNAYTLAKARQQKRGTQSGHDLQFVVEIKGDKELKILIECKNYKNEIRLKDISDKLLAAKANNHSVPIDHWILVSPCADVSNELNHLIDLWEEKGEYPFKVQVWSPETRVSEFFGLLPEAYGMFFKVAESETHPKDWSETKKREVVEFWKRKLEPPLRLPKGWEPYLRSTGKFSLQGDTPEFEALFKHHITMHCKDETGALIQGKTLEEKVMEWLAKPTMQHPTLIVLGEFGDGKTVFSYILSRKLAEKFLESPSTGWLPVRFSLKDFAIESINSSRDFVRRRLEEFGADIDGWNTLKKSKYRLLAILDGFDEIAKKLDHKTILKNIKQIIECFHNEFSGMKMLITSRKYFFENQEHKDQLLQRIGNPELIQIAPIDRKTTAEHLLEYAKAINEEEKFNKLKDYYDPIGLSSKPLFLEMVKVSLKKLPNKDLDELILYETYTQQALERKSEYLEDDKLETAPQNIIENMKTILEKVAVELHQADAEFIYLSDVHGPPPQLLKRLWEMSNPEDQTYDDEIGRIAVRSLLKRIGTGISEEGKQWPVDFCHRSMREHFVARAVSKMIEHSQDQSGLFLKNCYLSYEIVFFASKLMKKSGFDYTANLLQLIQATKYRNEVQKFNVGHLGTNAANLLYQYMGTLPGNDWSHLVLDGVDFAGADLSGKDFSHTSFHYANLDNVNFTNADFSYCDLTGVRLEEASPVQAISVSPDENIYALYNDGIIREWNYKRGHIPQSINMAEIQSVKDARLIAQPGNDVMAVDNRQLIFYDRENYRLKQKAIIKIKPELKVLKASSNNILIIEDKDSQLVLQLVDLDEFAVIKSMEIGAFTLCDYLGDYAFIIYSKEQGLQIIDTTLQKRRTIILAHSEEITCLATCPCKDSDDKYRIAAGQANGGVIILQIALDDWKVTAIFEYRQHEKTVTDIAFIDENRVVSGGYDKKLVLAQINRQMDPNYVPLEFKMHLHCKGMNIDGVKPEEKRTMLEKLILNAAQME